MRLPGYRRLLWLMPPAYALHIVEEYTGGFPRWVTRVAGGEMSAAAFALNNALFMAVLIALTAWASRATRPLPLAVLVTWASANLFWDALFHVAAVPIWDRYSPGLVTAVMLYLPLVTIITVAIARARALSARVFMLCVAAGALLMAFVIWAGLFRFAV